MKPQINEHLNETIKEWWKGKRTPLEKAATRQGFGKGILQAAKKHKELFAITADLTGSTNLTAFKEAYPERFLNVGVAEQTLAGVAAGIASEGHTVVATSFATFNPGRNWDFVRTQIGINNQPVIIVGSHAGLATGPDGATHQALEDIALIRSLHNFTILNPLDETEAAKAIQEAVQQKKPTYLRLAREKLPTITNEKTPYKIGKGNWLVKGTQATIITTGITAYEALKAAKQLWEKEKTSVGVLHIGTIQPLDEKAIKEATKTNCVITVEDHNINGGLGSAVAEILAENAYRGTFKRLGTISYGQSGNYDELYKAYGLDANNQAKTIQKLLTKKTKLPTKTTRKKE